MLGLQVKAMVIKKAILRAELKAILEGTRVCNHMGTTNLSWKQIVAWLLEWCRTHQWNNNAIPILFGRYDRI